jgi:hypothetical protein
MQQIITRVNELDPQKEYKGVMIYIYSDRLDTLQNIKEKILQVNEKCTATIGQRKYYENRLMLVIEGDFSSERLKDVFDYLTGQNVPFASVNESGEINISNMPVKFDINEMPGKAIIPDDLDDVDLHGALG